ncbi:hypothetical protein V8B97DRAFT_2020726 [Scleroderma yunnanense]
MVYCVPLIIFMDDVSGSHHTIYMSNTSLPHEMVEKEFFVWFVTSSPHAAPMKLMAAMKDSICQAAESGIIAWDCKENEDVMLLLCSLFVAENNPMQAEECSHAGLNCNYFCRTCHVSSTKEYKSGEVGYNSIFVPGIPCTPEGTAAEVQKSFDITKLSEAMDKVRIALSLTEVHDTMSSVIISTVVDLGKDLQKQAVGTMATPENEIQAALEKHLEDILQGYTVDKAINPLLGMDGINIHKDMPMEILHTVLLGVVKYFWGQTVFMLEKAKLMDVFQSCLDSLDTKGLNAPSLNTDYICCYKGGLIGKHFKSLTQVMPFVIHDLMLKTILDGWTLIGELVVLLWHTEIADTEKYLVQLTQMIDNFLNFTTQCAPKQYESFNHVFHLLCVFSNQQSPSWDSCRTFACHDTLKHVVTGSYWFNQETKKWVRAGDEVLEYLDQHPAQAQLLGLDHSHTCCAAALLNT